MNHNIIIGPYVTFSPHYEAGATLSIFDGPEIAHHICIDKPLYQWIMRHIIDLIYGGLLFCYPCNYSIGSNHYKLINQE